MERSLIKLLKKRGVSHSQIAALTQRDRKTVAQIVQQPADPSDHRPPTGSNGDALTASIEQWVHQGLPTRRMLE